ncbi:DUF3152 domain-containing protein [Streptomyces termitum]|uniref:DUF3152 domain-containing protein n=1 Tax=Streptomyces termitum TaxID=67368 RepID=UPI0033B45E64
MGRHSRKGQAPATDTGRAPVVDSGAGTGRRRRSGDAPDARGDGSFPGHGTPGTPAHGTPVHGPPSPSPSPYGAPQRPAYGTAPRPAPGGPAYGGQGRPAPGPGGPRRPAPAPGTPAHGTPAYGTPAYGTPAYGSPAQGAPARGTPAPHGTPRGGTDTPAHGTPHTPAHGIPVRGGHPADEETGAPGAERYGPAGGGRRVPGPRRRAEPPAPATGTAAEAAAPGEDQDTAAARGGMGRTLTGIAAAAVTTCLALVVAGQVAEGKDDALEAHAAQGAGERTADGSASRSDGRATPPSPAPKPTVRPPTYEQLMTRQFPMDPKLFASGDFETVSGFDKAPGRGEKHRYRIDVEKGLGLDAGLFARAVQQTLNDKRSWAGQGAMTFERISSGEADFVITLASPVTTAKWCAKSGLDTTVDNVSCDSASTERVMINAFRWAQGAATFGPKAMYAYRQMLINHEVGHRLGHNHVSCRTPGALAPVMQQQTKTLDIDGIVCRPNPWVYPGN